MKIEIYNATFGFKISIKTNAGTAFLHASTSWNYIGKGEINNKAFPHCYNVEVSYRIKKCAFTVACQPNKTNSLRLLKKLIDNKD